MATPWSKIKADYLSGMTPQELSKKYKLQANTISVRLCKDGLTKKRKELENNIAEVVQEKITEELNYPAIESFKSFQKMRDLALCPDGENGKIDLTNAIKAQEQMSKLAKHYVELKETTVIDKTPLRIEIVE